MTAQSPSDPPRRPPWDQAPQVPPQQPAYLPTAYEQPVPARQPSRSARHNHHAQPATAAGRLALTAAESFWYVLQCVAFGAGYFAKVPVKKALSEAGLAQMTSAEQFWYVLMCIGFGAGYFAKVPVKKALSEARLS
jgi:hypothetical protein